MNISCVITDDEPIARRGLENYVGRIPFLQLAGVCEDAIQLNAFLRDHRVDLIFLDIEMPVLTGIELLKAGKNMPQVILTTAYEHYALQGFDLDVLDYLLKPISFERFLKAVNKSVEYFESRSGIARDYIFIKTDGRFEKIVLNEILYIEALENYIAITTKERKWLTHITLKAVQEQLPAVFFQTHKSWVVNITQITAVDNINATCGGSVGLS
ncbi:MAG: response regulator transcription factor [Chitinophagaceae bacterium]|nr:MAG: response regulator transcription factor [Chitinophagaceae bacterium]